MSEKAVNSVNKTTLLNWCLKNYAEGASVVSRWDVAKNASEGVYITDIPYDYDKYIWVRESMDSTRSKQVLLADMLTGGEKVGKQCV